MEGIMFASLDVHAPKKKSAAASRCRGRADAQPKIEVTLQVFLLE